MYRFTHPQAKTDDLFVGFLVSSLFQDEQTLHCKNQFEKKIKSCGFSHGQSSGDLKLTKRRNEKNGHFQLKSSTKPISMYELWFALCDTIQPMKRHGLKSAEKITCWTAFILLNHSLKWVFFVVSDLMQFVFFRFDPLPSYKISTEPFLPDRIWGKPVDQKSVSPHRTDREFLTSKRATLDESNFDPSRMIDNGFSTLGLGSVRTYWKTSPDRIHLLLSTTWGGFCKTREKIWDFSRNARRANNVCSCVPWPLTK